MRKTSFPQAVFDCLRDERYHRYNLNQRTYTEDVIEHYLRYWWTDFDRRFGEPSQSFQGDITSDDYHIWLDLSTAVAGLPQPYRTVARMWGERYKDPDIRAYLESVDQVDLARGGVLKLMHRIFRMLREQLEVSVVLDKSVTVG